MIDIIIYIALVFGLVVLGYSVLVSLFIVDNRNLNK